jgi:hypothetical protein
VATGPSGSVDVGNVVVPNIDIPSGSTTGSSSADAPLSGVSGGSGSGEALLIAAVALAVAAPIIVYAVDSPAEPEVLARHEGFNARARLLGGAVSTADPSNWQPIFGFRGELAKGAFGFDTSIESTVDQRYYGSIDAHLLLRPPPRQHIEGALAIGARRVVFGGAERNGAELALPHRYMLTRDHLNGLAIEVRPGVFLGNRGFDFSLEAGVAVPLGQTLSFTGGARVFSVDTEVRAQGSAGVRAAF